MTVCPGMSRNQSPHEYVSMSLITMSTQLTHQVRVHSFCMKRHHVMPMLLQWRPWLIKGDTVKVHSKLEK